MDIMDEIRLRAYAKVNLDVYKRQVLGSGVSSDAHHITAPREDGEGQMNAIRWGMKASGVDESEIGYILSLIHILTGLR